MTSPKVGKYVAGGLLVALIVVAVIATNRSNSTIKLSSSAKQAGNPAPFEPRLQYSNLRKALMRSSLADLQQLFSNQLTFNKDLLDSSKTRTFLEAYLSDTQSARDVSFEPVDCQEKGQEVSCRVTQDVTSAYRITPHAQFSVAHTKRNDLWEWQGSAWKVIRITIDEVRISD